ncbi:MAG TPA: hypothetical protein VJS69_02325, partial [Candidatus Krumholzibacteria bacterium]|nr:hypothetical protein [Candidatus Krumholzibacteria bacterium]
MRREAIRALEALCDSEYLEHTGQFTENGNVVLSYRRPRGAMRLRVAVPQAEWNSWSSVPASNSEAPAPPDPAGMSELP